MPTSACDYTRKHKDKVTRTILKSRNQMTSAWKYINFMSDLCFELCAAWTGINIIRYEHYFP